MKKYYKALVIGKFMPLHKGHLALIDFATTQAETVSVCVTGHDGEVISSAKRAWWVIESYIQNDKFEEAYLGIFAYDSEIVQNAIGRNQSIYLQRKYLQLLYL